ncbi:hypothetical protein Tco_0761530 [Tanacetum coccineum]
MRNRMCTYLKNMGGYKHNQLKGKSYEEIQKLFDKTYKHVNSFVPMASDDKEKEILDDFDRQHVLDLYRLVKERFETASPEGYDRLLWRYLITVFEPKKTYPLTQEMLTRMLSGKLEVYNESEMAFELLRFTRSQIEK